MGTMILKMKLEKPEMISSFKIAFKDYITRPISRASPYLRQMAALLLLAASRLLSLSHPSRES